MSDKRFGSILVVVVTLLYYVFFHFNCIIIPYTAGYGKEFIRGGNNPTGGQVAEGRDGVTPGTGSPITEAEPEVIGQAFQPLQELPQPVPDQKYRTEPLSELLTSQAQPALPQSDVTGQTVQAQPGNKPRTIQPRQGSKPQAVQPRTEGTDPNGSRVLLSGNRAAKALSSLSLKDKLWLLRVLSRCSMEEFLRIRAMLEDGVTYQENLEMYRILRHKVTDEEQQKLDSLIEAYTR
ncbi:MAG: hypothetical protein ACOX42_11235 [Clostridia bacterium]